MPPGRAQGGLRSEQMQQHKRLVSSIIKLNGFARVSTLKEVADGLNWAISWSKWVGTLPKSQQWAEDVLGDNSLETMLEAVFSAASNGLKQLHSAWPRDDAAMSQTHSTPYVIDFIDAVKTVSCFFLALATCKNSDWYILKSTFNEPDMAIRTGLLQNMKPVVRNLLMALPMLQQTAPGAEQQQPARFEALITLAVIMLTIWSGLFARWKGSRLAGSLIADTLKPSASLAIMLLQITSAGLTVASDTSSSSATVLPGPGHSGGTGWWARGASCQTGLSFAEQIIEAAYAECTVAQENSDSDAAAAAAEAALASADVLKLVFAGLATTAAVQLKQHEACEMLAASGGIPALQNAQYQQRQQPGDHGYAQLLAALGINPSDKAFSEVLQGTTSKLYSAHGLRSCVCAVVDHLYSRLHSSVRRQQQQKLQDSSSSSSSATSTSGYVDSGCRSVSQEKAFAHGLLQQLIYPVLCTLKDMAILLPDTDSVISDANALATTLMTYLTVSQCLEYVFITHDQQQQVLQWLLHPMFDKVCRVGHLLDQQADEESAGPGVMSAATVQVQVVRRLWMLATKFYFADVAGVYHIRSKLPDHLVSFIRQHPTTSLAAVETLVRTGLSVSTDLLQQQPLQAILQAVLAALLECDDDGEYTLVQEVYDQSCVQQVLYSLICCRFKMMMVLNAAAVQVKGKDRDDTRAARLLTVTNMGTEGHVITCMLQMHEQLAQQICTPTAEEHAADPGQQQQQQPLAWPGSHWMALLGKAMYASAVSIMQLGVDYANFYVPFTTGQQYVASVFDGAENSTAAAEVQEQLKRLAAALADNSDTEETEKQLLLQFQQCGSAICAALPVKFCCNNLACVNLAKLSEQQLVAGKGSRCSGCKVARYCSRDCQLKHWKQHKKTCKRIQQAEAAANS